MQQRITRKDIDRRLEYINKKLAQRGADLQLDVSRWSPGDGWTRNEIVKIEENGGERDMSFTLTTREAYDHLMFLIRILDQL